MRREVFADEAQMWRGPILSSFRVLSCLICVLVEILEAVKLSWQCFATRAT